MLFGRLDGDRVGASAQRLIEAVSSHSPQGRMSFPSHEQSVTIT
jgi:hypothetical protein